ncbi:MAG: hypothetical protein ABEH90_02685 [Halolamina sp.]
MTRFSDIVETRRQQRESAEETEPSNGPSETDAENLEEPAFPFAAASQEEIYPRESTYERFEDFRDFELKRDLRDRGLRNLSGRELDDALLRLAMAHGEAYADLVETARRES